MANGKIRKITALGLNPVIINVKTRSKVAMELREAKKPLVVENRPINASASIGKLTSGAKKTLSSEPLHKNTGAKPVLIFGKNFVMSKSLANNSSMMVSGWLIIFMRRAEIPAITNSPTIARGSFGKLLTMKRRCGCRNTKKTQNTAKYIIYGVKMANNSAIAKSNEYIGLGRFSPWILEPSQSSKVGQKTIIISGVPEPAINKNGVDRTIKMEARSETLLLNQRFRSKINSSPKARPTSTLGNLMAYGVKPKMRIEIFCKSLYGRSTRSPFSGASIFKLYELVADSISAAESPCCAESGNKNSIATKAAPSTM